MDKDTEPDLSAYAYCHDSNFNLVENLNIDVEHLLNKPDTPSLPIPDHPPKPRKVNSDWKVAFEYSEQKITSYPFGILKRADEESPKPQQSSSVSTTQTLQSETKPSPVSYLTPLLSEKRHSFTKIDESQPPFDANKNRVPSKTTTSVGNDTSNRGKPLHTSTNASGNLNKRATKISVLEEDEFPSLIKETHTAKERKEKKSPSAEGYHRKWTEDEELDLIRMSREGQSVSEISERFPHRTKSAISRKIQILKGRVPELFQVIELSEEEPEEGEEGELPSPKKNLQDKSKKELDRSKSKKKLEKESSESKKESDKLEKELSKSKKESDKLEKESSKSKKESDKLEKESSKSKKESEKLEKESSKSTKDVGLKENHDHNLTTALLEVKKSPARKEDRTPPAKKSPALSTKKSSESTPVDFDTDRSETKRNTRNQRQSSKQEPQTTLKEKRNEVKKTVLKKQKREFGEIQLTKDEDLNQEILKKTRLWMSHDYEQQAVWLQGIEQQVETLHTHMRRSIRANLFSTYHLFHFFSETEKTIEDRSAIARATELPTLSPEHQMLVDTLVQIGFERNLSILTIHAFQGNFKKSLSALLNGQVPQGKQAAELESSGHRPLKLYRVPEEELFSRLTDCEQQLSELMSNLTPSLEFQAKIQPLDETLKKLKLEYQNCEQTFNCYLNEDK